MKNTWKIARWEIMRNLTNKQFIIGLLITPILFAVFAGLPAIIERFNQPAQVTYLVVDEVNILPALQDSVPEHIVFEEHDNIDTAAATVTQEHATGYFHLAADFFNTGEVELVQNEMNNEAAGIIEATLTKILQQERLHLTHMDPEQLAFVTTPAVVIQTPMDDADLPGGEQIVVSIVFLALIFLLIFSSGAMLMTSALQERRDRMAEVILSSIRSSDLMQGKILGHFILGIIQLVFWVTLAIPVVLYLTDFPLWEALSQTNLALLGFFGLFGYLLFAALFVGMGATMEDLQSAGNSQGLVIMLPMLSFVFIAPVISNPSGFISQLVSYIPFTSPVIMVLRDVISNVPMWQILLSGLILILTTLLIAKMAAKIFRVGMLMYGKNATPREIFKWLRYKDI